MVNEAVRVLDALAAPAGTSSHLTEYLIGGCSIDRYGTALTAETLAACQEADAVLLGAVGGPKWDDPAAAVRPEQGLLALRKGLGVFANLRPVKVHPELVDASPLKPEKLAGVDLLVVRELTGGLYFGQPKGREMVDGLSVPWIPWNIPTSKSAASWSWLSSWRRSRRKKVTSVDKANVLGISRLWRADSHAISAGSIRMWPSTICWSTRRPCAWYPTRPALT